MVELIQPGDKIVVSHTKELDERYSYKSKVVEVGAKNTLTILLPQKFGVFLNLDTYTSNFLVVVYSKRYLLEFRATFVNYENDGQLKLAVIRMVSSGRKLQRREFYRLFKSLELEFTLTNKEKNKNIDNIYKGILIDISGGGIRFSSNKYLEVNTTINIKIELGGILNLTGKVINKESIDGGLIQQYRVSFINIEDHKREYIINHIWHEQRNLGRIID